MDIVVRICASQNIPCMILCDTSHTIYWDWAETFIVDKGSDSVDFALINRVSEGDIVVTQDYGLASMCLARKAHVIHQDGWEYTQDNIDALLLVRHESRKARSSRTRIKGPKKRTQSQDTCFQANFEMLLQTIAQGKMQGGS